MRLPPAARLQVSNMKMETLQDLVDSFQNRHSLCLAGEEEFLYKQAFRMISDLAGGFLALGLEPGDRAMLISGNRPEWILTSLALNCAGIIDVPRGEKASDGELNYIIKHSAPKMIIVEDEKSYDRIKDIKRHGAIISIEKIKGLKSIGNVRYRGKKYKGNLPELTPDTVATHLYTSGTTGEPKAAELTHGNYISNVIACEKKLKLSENDRGMSLLPLWHVFERLVEYVFLSKGVSIFYSSIAGFSKDLKAIKPTVMAVVPRILGKIFDNKVMRKIEGKSKFNQGLFKLFLKLSIESRKKGLNPIRLLGIFPHNYLEKEVFSKIREGFGGEMRVLISGGGKLRRDIDEFFFAAGLPILEGYGLTETSPVIAVRSLEEFSLGTVGTPLENLQVKILDGETGKQLRRGKRGVIYVKGPSVMKCYYNNDYETGKAFRDGWFDTGDLGCIDKKGNLVITGRKKNIIVLSNGENISPELIEETLKKSALIANVVIVGQDWKGLGALVEPDFEILENLHPGYLENPDNSKIQKLFRRQIRDLVSPLTGFREFECIKSFKILGGSLEPGKELTLTFKVRRKVVEKVFSDEIESLNMEINGRR